MRRDGTITVRKDMTPNLLTSALYSVFASGSAVAGHYIALGYIEDPDTIGMEEPVSTIYAAPGGVAGAGLMLQLCAIFHLTPWGRRVDNKLGEFGQYLQTQGSRCIGAMFSRCRGGAGFANDHLMESGVYVDESLPRVPFKMSIPKLLLTQSDHLLMVASNCALPMIPILIDVSDGVDLYTNEAARHACYAMIALGYYLQARNYSSSFKGGEPSAKVVESLRSLQETMGSQMARQQRTDFSSSVF